MEKINILWLDGACYDPFSLGLLYRIKSMQRKYVDENMREIKRSDVVNSVMSDYYNEKKCSQWHNDRPGISRREPHEVYKIDPEYKAIVDEERIYILYLMDISIVEISKLFGYSRPTIYKKIKHFEKERLQEYFPFGQWRFTP